MSGKSLMTLFLVAAVSVGGHRSSTAGEGGPGKAVVAKPQAGKPTPKLSRPRITISRETTFLTGPLRPDGYIDYVAAINEECSKGVTPENNAAVPLLQAFGPGEIEKDLREPFFRKLGIAPLSAEGEYIVSLGEIAKRSTAKSGEAAPAPAASAGQDAAEKLGKEWNQAMARPWSKEEFPLVAAWLEQNERQMDLIVQGMRRPRFYVPMVCSGESMMLSAMFPRAVQVAREAARMCQTRALLRIKAGKVDEAWGDIAACHRLARHLAQGPSLVEYLTAIGIDSVAREGDLALAHDGHLSAEKAKQFADELRSLPPMPRLAEFIDRGQRYYCLDSAAWVARHGGRGACDLIDCMSDVTTVERLLARLIFLGPVDWNESLRAVNASFDRQVQALAKPAGPQRRAAIRQLERDSRRVADEARDPKWFVKNLLSTRSLSRATGRQFGQIMLALSVGTESTCATLEDRAAAERTMGELLFALAAYRAEHGEYPDELAKICPKCIKSLPEDPFGTGPIRYKREPKGYVLYSLGPNGKDDGGHNWILESRPDLPEDQRPKIPHDADDVFIRLPPKGR